MFFVMVPDCTRGGSRRERREKEGGRIFFHSFSLSFFPFLKSGEEGGGIASEGARERWREGETSVTAQVIHGLTACIWSRGMSWKSGEECRVKQGPAEPPRGAPGAIEQRTANQPSIHPIPSHPVLQSSTAQHSPAKHSTSHPTAISTQRSSLLQNRNMYKPQRERGYLTSWHSRGA